MIDRTRLLEPTPLLDFRAKTIARLIDARGGRQLSEHDRIGAAYDFVRNEILFGYNRADDIPASEVLANGYGQCNTKGTVLMALLRGLGLPCRLHGFTIRKAVQRGVVPEAIYPIAPEEILHSWVEVWTQGQCIEFEGFILDNGFPAAAGARRDREALRTRRRNRLPEGAADRMDRRKHLHPEDRHRSRLRNI